MNTIEMAAGVAGAVLLLFFLWRNREAFPYLLVAVLGLEYFGGATDAGSFTVPKLGFAALALAQFIFGRVRLRLFPRAVIPVLLLYVGYFAASTLWSVAPERAIVRSVTLVALLAAFVAAAGAIESTKDVHRFLRALVLYGAASAITAFVQMSQGTMLLDEDLGGRVGGLGVNPTEGAFYLSIALLITIAYHIDPRNAEGWLSIASVRIILISVLSVGLLMTGSRGGISAFLVAFSVLALVKRRSLVVDRTKILNRVTVVGLVVGMMVLVMTIPRQMLWERAASAKSDEFGNRFVIWEQVGEQVYQNPMFGSGLNSAMIANSNNQDTVTYSTHNALLTAILDGGIVGLLLLLWICWRVFKAVVMLLRSPMPMMESLGLQLSAMVLCTAVIMMSHDLGFNKMLWMMLGVVEATMALNMFSLRKAPRLAQQTLRVLPRHAKA